MKPFAKVFKFAMVSTIAGVLILIGSIPIKLAIAAHQAPEPEAIMVLGGGTGREEAAAQLARDHPNLEIWVSSGDALPHTAYAIFQAANVVSERVHLDYRATDTVTNFTTLVAQFKQRDIQHLFVVTSDFHMPRTVVIATIVLGHSGITFTPIVVPSNRPAESWLRIVRDGGRSVLWILTGRTGGRLGQSIEAGYMRYFRPQKKP